MNGPLGIILAIALQSSTPSGAIPTPAISRQATPQEIFKKLCATGSDDDLLHALAVEINPMPNWPQMVMNGDPSVCQRNPKPLPVVSVGTTWP